MHLSAVNLHNWCPSSISTSKISHVTENGQWLGVNKKGNHTTHIGSFEWKGKKRNTTNNEDNGGEIKLELFKIIVIATTVAMKMTMGKILSDNNNDSTNKKMKSWSFRRQYLRNINTSLYNNNARLCVLESNRCAKVKDIFHFFCEDNNARHWNGSRFKGWLSPHMECGLKIGVYSVPSWA